MTLKNCVFLALALSLFSVSVSAEWKQQSSHNQSWDSCYARIAGETGMWKCEHDGYYVRSFKWVGGGTPCTGDDVWDYDTYSCRPPPEPESCEDKQGEQIGPFSTPRLQSCMGGCRVSTVGVSMQTGDGTWWSKYQYTGSECSNSDGEDMPEPEMTEDPPVGPPSEVGHEMGTDEDGSTTETTTEKTDYKTKDEEGRDGSISEETTTTTKTNSDGSTTTTTTTTTTTNHGDGSTTSERGQTTTKCDPSGNCTTSQTGSGSSSINPNLNPNAEEGEGGECDPEAANYMICVGMSEEIGDNVASDSLAQLETVGQDVVDSFQSGVEDSIAEGESVEEPSALEDIVNSFIPSGGACTDLTIPYNGHNMVISCARLEPLRQWFGWMLAVLSGLSIFYIALRPQTS